MDKKVLNYETLLTIAREVSASKEPDEVIQLIVQSVVKGLRAKGCTLFLLNRKSNELEIAASTGLSTEYMNKGPVSSIHSIAGSLSAPVAVYDVMDDPRVQYPKEAKKEGIFSILSVPIMIRDHAMGSLRIYASEPWEFTLDDVNFVQAVAQLAGMRIELARMYKGCIDSIDLLKMRQYEKK